MRPLRNREKYPNLESLRAFHKGHRGKIALFLVFTVLSGTVALATPLFLSDMLISLTGGDYDRMAYLAAAVFGIVCAVAASGMAAEYFYTVTTNDLFLSIRRKVAYSTMSMRLSSVYDKGSGFFLERLNEDTREAAGVHLNIWRAVINLVVNLGFIGYITVLSPLLGLLFGAGLALLIFLEYLRVSRLLENMKKSKRAVEKVKSNEAEILKGIKEIKGLNARGPVVERHTAVSSKYVDVKYEREIYQKKMQNLIDTVKGGIDLSVLLFAGLYLLPGGMVELAAVLIIYTYKGNIYSLIAGLARIRDTYVNGELAAKRVNDIVRAPPGEVDTFGDRPIPGRIERIEFCDVSFGYTDDKKVLDGVSFAVEGAGVVGVVGKSGSGKSTIFGLLARFYDPTGGSILINGEDVSTLAEEDVRGRITPVLQDPYIFNDTVMNNLLLASPEATEEEVAAACRAACIHDEITEMPAGYDTVIGEGGATISGGQKQRLEIARVLLKGSEVMLFDEATSALDRNNLEKINDLVAELGRERIVLVIAHRLNVMRRCDRVIVLDEGRVVAYAPHDELMETCGYYRELFRRGAAAEQPPAQ
ncbi:MAG: ABC transporter ATP-binding protein/permease [Methanomassiliicoccaceae archaeon]|nr:ABC transporter ATP-binding protein/permease [Methanomassiliicoccaceae archaeon]